MTPEIYELWCECWIDEHPGRIPPTMEQTNQMMEMFGFTAEEIFGFERDEAGLS